MMRKFSCFFKHTATCYLQLLLFITLTTISGGVSGQTIRCLDPKICSPQIQINGAWNAPPILVMNEPTQLVLSFDDLSEDAERFFYKIEHCDEKFRPTQNLFESSYLQATSNSILMDDYEPSRNTTIPYYHYRLVLPNEDMRMLISGNYKLTLEREVDDERVEVLEAYFMIMERKTTVQASVTTITDIDFNQNHQQLTIDINYGQLNLHDAAHQLKCVVVKNRDWGNAVWLDTPSQIMNGKLRWAHDRRLIFKAGNEFRKFESLSTTVGALHTDRIEWDANNGLYNTILYADEPRRNYLYDEDHNGGFYIRNVDNQDDDTESDYTNIKFSLLMPRQLGTDIYVNGLWATFYDLERYKMEYNETTQSYEASIMLKQGYYEYCYNSSETEIEGNFYETENEYLIFVYATLPNERYTRLVGLGKIHSGQVQ